MSEADVPVLIIGAGPTGLVLALWLTRLGVGVRIVDRAAEPGTTSRAVGVQARTLELYDQMGLAGALIDAGVRVQALHLWVGGKSTARVPFGEIGEGLSPYPYMLTYGQDEHERMLIARLAELGVHVDREMELAGFAQDVDVVRATLRDARGAETTCTARYLAGCDGAHSMVREGICAGFPGGTYAQLFYVADVVATGQAINDEIHVDLDEADLLAVFPLKGQGHARYIGTVRAEAEAQGAQRTFADVSDRAMRKMKLETSEVRWFSTYHVHHRVADAFQGGRAFLLGDAAHIHSPAGGQGMNTGIGDAINLSWKLASVIRGTAPEVLLESYEQERIAFARRLVATTDRGFTFASSRGRFAAFVRMRIFPLIAPTLTTFGPLRRFMFRTISQLIVQYRRSTLSAGADGEVRGGDRLPWVPSASGTGDNFAPLRSFDWQVHVYGTPSADVRSACESLGLPLHAFGWSAEARHKGMQEGSAYLVRPDGYLAGVFGSARASELSEYFRTRGIQPVAPAARLRQPRGPHS